MNETTPLLRPHSFGWVWHWTERLQLVLSLILAVIIGLCISEVRWGESGHMVKEDLYVLYAFVSSYYSINSPYCNIHLFNYSPYTDLNLKTRATSLSFILLYMSSFFFAGSNR